MLNPKRADAEGSRSKADGSKRPLYSYLSPTTIYDTPILQKSGPKVSSREAKYLIKENSNKNEFSAQFLADLGSAEESKRKAVIFSLFLFDLRLNLRPGWIQGHKVQGWKSQSYAESFIW